MPETHSMLRMFAEITMSLTVVTTSLSMKSVDATCPATITKVHACDCPRIRDERLFLSGDAQDMGADHEPGGPLWNTLVRTPSLE